MVTLLTAVICLQAASVLGLLPDRTTRANRGGCERRFLQQLTSRDTGQRALCPVSLCYSNRHICHKAPSATRHRISQRSGKPDRGDYADEMAQYSWIRIII